MRASAEPPLRLTGRGRVVLIVLVMLVSCLVLSVARVTSSAAPTGDDRPARVHVVRSGETLWGIARGLAPDGDTRVAVARLAGLNRLETTDLVPGQTLRLP
ncbi:MULTISPECIES: LysM peptidoglycan-binding domain-containing protein [Protofrankia]|uniref:Peptidoglycan-binding lysin domain protein n=2 Tax=Candidatus Protofrankia datiscae TaxID=2716812 RepID=F8B379_9ACTN|nr:MULTISPECIES: LysM peptidoglycan-binding domain-containing protein [Protofrankia]AEH10879.1 Peptidoglycan-binding lysin domain protein [Candidatus Protofrankia datiscae]